MILGFIIKKEFGSYDDGFIAMFMTVAFLMPAFEGLADEYRGKVCEDICLYERN